MITEARWLAAVAVLLAWGFPAGAESAEDERAVLAAATAVAQAHRSADERAGRDPAGAAGLLAAALEGAFPVGERGRALRADLFARRSQLLLVAGDAGAALVAARLGLAEGEGRPATAFTALLLLREGEALEARGDDAGAVAAYEQVVASCRELLERNRKGTP